jgi:hypothetical protein
MRRLRWLWRELSCLGGLISEGLFDRVGGNCARSRTCNSLLRYPGTLLDNKYSSMVLGV